MASTAETKKALPCATLRNEMKSKKAKGPSRSATELRPHAGHRWDVNNALVPKLYGVRYHQWHPTTVP